LPPASGSADPRRHAVEVLARVEARRAHAARLLPGAQPATREIVLGALRWQLTLDHLLAPHLQQPPSSLDAPVRALLRAGLYETIRMDTPAPIAVSEAVRLAKVLAPRAAGLVNAVLRRAAASAWPDPDDERLPLAIRFSHPPWLVERWLAELGEAATRRLLAANQRAAPLTLLAAACDHAFLAAPGCRLEAHPHVPGVLVCGDHAASAAQAVSERHAYAIDSTAVVVARLLPPSSGTLVDLAAAPGGKSLVLACERAAAAHLALDRSLARATLMRGALAVARGRARIVAADASRPPLRAGSCTAVLLDAPCSGTGTLRRHPEIRWRLAPEHLAELATVQRGLALAARELLAPGGVLLYATCSLEPEENSEVVAGLGLTPVGAGLGVPGGVPTVPLESGGTVIPPYPWGDGFTVHLLRRDA